MRCRQRAKVSQSSSFPIAQARLPNSWTCSLFSPISMDQSTLTPEFTILGLISALPVIASAYNIVVALATVLNWRGVWTAMDIWLGVDLWSCISSSFLGLGILVGTGTTKTSAMSAPFFSMSDHQLRRGGEQYDFPTRFRQKVSSRYFLLSVLNRH